MLEFNLLLTFGRRRAERGRQPTSMRMRPTRMRKTNSEIERSGEDSAPCRLGG